MTVTQKGQVIEITLPNGHVFHVTPQADRLYVLGNRKLVLRSAGDRAVTIAQEVRK